MSGTDLSQEIRANLPYMRRYARALSGSQKTGDQFAVATMQALIAAPDDIEAESVKIDLFRAFHKIWRQSDGSVSDEPTNPREQQARGRLKALTPNSREALLLSAIEGFSGADIAAIMDIENQDALDLVAKAFDEMRDMVTGDVLVIEDEAIISMDLEGIIRSMGHNVAGVARTMKSAVALGNETSPQLILADIKLADGSSGIDAVNDLISDLGELPVIFITAFPEELLTGERPEPAFLITKPYSEDQVRAAISQAMFFSSTEGLSLG